MHKLILLNLMMIILASCNESQIIQSMTTSHLIGGSSAPPSWFRSTVYLPNILDNCTASKIGKRAFITAAHCVIDDSEILKHVYRKGTQMRVQTHYSVSYTVTINETYTHQSYVKGRKEIKKAKLSSWIANLETYDVAIITVKEETPQIPIAAIARDELRSGERIIIGGYGSEEGRNGPTNRSGRYQFHRSVAHEISTMSIYTTGLLKSSERDQFVFATKGKAIDKEAASLAPGDSGGPVYREADGTLVGINSSATYFYMDNFSSTNIHVRLDTIREWIEDIIAIE
jgi:secreted trypsin-like serine protease